MPEIPPNRSVKLKSYLLSCGNSKVGTVGLTASVSGVGRTQALAILKAALPTQVKIPVPAVAGDRIKFIHVQIAVDRIRPEHLTLS